MSDPQDFIQPLSLDNFAEQMAAGVKRSNKLIFENIGIRFNYQNALDEYASLCPWWRRLAYRIYPRLTNREKNSAVLAAVLKLGEIEIGE